MFTSHLRNHYIDNSVILHFMLLVVETESQFCVQCSNGSWLSNAEWEFDFSSLMFIIVIVDRKEKSQIIDIDIVLVQRRSSQLKYVE